MVSLQRFALKSKPRKKIKALLCNAFIFFLVARLIGNCCKYQIIAKLRVNPHVADYELPDGQISR